jgi:hypothetical protein
VCIVVRHGLLSERKNKYASGSEMAKKIRNKRDELGDGSNYAEQSFFI